MVTKENFPEFKRLYEEAVKAGKTSFWFEGVEVLTAFAKYVVEYFEGER